MLHKRHSCEIPSNENNENNINNLDSKFLLTSKERTNPQTSKEPSEIPKRQKIKRNRSINPKYIFIQNLQQLCSESTPKKKKSLYKRGKSVKFRISPEQDQSPTPCIEEYEIIHDPWHSYPVYFHMNWGFGGSYNDYFSSLPSTWNPNEDNAYQYGLKLMYNFSSIE